MERQEYEIIEHPKIQNLNIFIVNLDYRNPHSQRVRNLCRFAGEAAVYMNGRTETAGQNAILLFNPDQPHEIRAVGDKSTLILAVQLSLNFMPATPFHLRH